MDGSVYMPPEEWAALVGLGLIRVRVRPHRMQVLRCTKSSTVSVVTLIRHVFTSLYCNVYIIAEPAAPGFVLCVFFRVACPNCI